MRLVPVHQTFQRMRRLIRDLSHKSGKALELVISGEETELGMVADAKRELSRLVVEGLDPFRESLWLASLAMGQRSRFCASSSRRTLTSMIDSG